MLVNPAKGQKVIAVVSKKENKCIFAFDNLYVWPMKELTTLITGIEYKFGRLSGMYRTLQQEKKELCAILEEQKQQIEIQRQKIEQLEERIKLLTIAKSIETTEGNVEAKVKINELVREIDKCIGLLNI